MISINQQDIDCWEGFLALLRRSPDHGITVFLTFLEDNEAAEGSLLTETVKRIHQDLCSAGAVVYSDDGDHTEISKKIKKSDVVIAFCTPAYYRATEIDGTKNLVLTTISRQIRLKKLPIIPIFWSGEFLQAVPEPWQKYYLPRFNLAESYESAVRALWPVLNQRLSLHALLNSTDALHTPLSYEEHCFFVMILPSIIKAQKTTIHFRTTLLRALHFFSATPKQHRVQMINTLCALDSLSTIKRALQLSLLLPQEQEDTLLLQARTFELWLQTLKSLNKSRVTQSERELTEIVMCFIVLIYEKYKHLMSMGTKYRTELIEFLNLYADLITRTQKDLALSISMSISLLEARTFGDTHPIQIPILLNISRQYRGFDLHQEGVFLDKALEIASTTQQPPFLESLLPKILTLKANYFLEKKIQKKMKDNDCKQINILLQQALALTTLSNKSNQQTTQNLKIIFKVSIGDSIMEPLTRAQEIICSLHGLFSIYRMHKVSPEILDEINYYTRLLLFSRLPEFAKVFSYYVLLCMERDTSYLRSSLKNFLKIKQTAEQLWQKAMIESGSNPKYLKTQVGLPLLFIEQPKSGLIEPNKARPRLNILPLAEYLTGDKSFLSAVFSAFLKYFASLPSTSVKKMKQTLYLSLPTHFDPTVLKYFIESLEKINWVLHINASISTNSIATEEENINHSCAAIIIVTPETATDQKQQACIDKLLQVNACAAFPIIPILYTGTEEDMPENLRPFISVMQHPWLHNHNDCFLGLYIKQWFHLAMRCGFVEYLLNTKNRTTIDQALIPVVIWTAATLSEGTFREITESATYLVKLAFDLINLNNDHTPYPVSALIQLLILLQKYQMVSQYEQCILWLQPKAVEFHTLAKQQISEMVLRLGTTNELISWIESLAKFAPLTQLLNDDREEEQLWNLMLAIMMNYAIDHMAQVITCCKNLIYLYLLREDFVHALEVMQRCMALLQKHLPQDQQAFQEGTTIVQTLEKLSHHWSKHWSIRELLMISLKQKRSTTAFPQTYNAINNNIWDTSWAQTWKINTPLKLPSLLEILDQNFSGVLIQQINSAIKTLMIAGLFAIAKPYILKLQTALENQPHYILYQQEINENLAILALQTGDFPSALAYLKKDSATQRPSLTQRITELELFAESSFLSVNQQYSLEKVNSLYQQNKQNLEPEAITAKIMQSDCNILEQQAFLSLLLIILNDQQDSQGLQLLLSCFSALQTVQQQKEDAPSARLLLSVCVVLAQEYARKQQGAEQETYLMLALQLCEKDESIDWRISVRILLALADAKEQQKAFQEAEQQVKEAVEQVRKNDPYDVALLKLYKRWISLLYILQHNDTLLTVWHAILALCDHAFSSTCTQQVECYQNLAMLYETDKDWPQAIEMWKKYLELVKTYTADDVDLQNAYQWSVLTAECALLHAQKQKEEDSTIGSEQRLCMKNNL